MKNLNIFDLDENKAREILEQIRWPDGAVCPHCGCIEVYALKAKKDSKSPVRKGVYKCSGCRKQFTVTVGTIFSGSHIKLHKWLQAIYLMCSSKKGISAHQIHRMLGVTYKSAWFMVHRVRYAMDQSPLKDLLRGKIEADETFIGGKRTGRGRGRATEGKEKVVALVERNGRVKSSHVDKISAENLRKILRENVEPESELYSDDFASYRWASDVVSGHHIINHSKGDYVNGDIHTNTVEGYFGLFKRGVIGTFHHVSKTHLHRYLSEFDFRYNYRKVDDKERTIEAIKGFEGKRLYYRQPKAVRTDGIREARIK